MKHPMPVFIRITTHTSVKVTIAGFGAPSDETPRLAKQVSASVVLTFHTRFRPAVNTVRTNLLWFTSQQGLLTTYHESLFSHHTFQWFCPKNSKGVTLTVLVGAQHIAQSNQTHPPPPHPRSSRCSGRRTFRNKVLNHNSRVEGTGNTMLPIWDLTSKHHLSLNSCHCPLHCPVHTKSSFLPVAYLHKKFYFVCLGSKFVMTCALLSQKAVKAENWIWKRWHSSDSEAFWLFGFSQSPFS